MHLLEVRGRRALLRACHLSTYPMGAELTHVGGAPASQGFSPPSRMNAGMAPVLAAAAMSRRAPATASSVTAPMCQRAAAATLGAAFETATELGTPSMMARSFSESPKTQTSLRPMPNWSMRIVSPLILETPAGRMSNVEEAALGKTKSNSGKSRTRSWRRSSMWAREWSLWMLFFTYVPAGICADVRRNAWKALG